MEEAMNHPEHVPIVAARLARDPRLAERLAHFYERLRALPRTQRRAIGRRARLTLAAAALLLALSRAPAIPPARADAAATITVANHEVGMAANGICSLIEAINNANDKVDGIGEGAGNSDCAAGNPGGADIIALPSGGAFSVTKSVDYSHGYTGLPLIDSTITIQGNNSTISRGGTNIFRFLTVVGGDLTLNNLTLTGGRMPDFAGGAVYASDGKLTISNCTITGNEGSAGAGVFAIKSELMVSNSTISENVAYSGFSSGGAIYASDSHTTILNTTVSGNRVTNGNGGGVYVLGGDVAINNLTATDNIASSGGGAMVYLTEATISNSTLSGNKAIGDSAGLGGYGGGLNIVATTATITATEANDNTAYFGGGVAALGGTTTIDGMVITANEVTEDGGGVYAKDATLRMGKVTISDNSAEVRGGGVFGSNSELTLTGSTISGNEAGTHGGGLVLAPIQDKAGDGAFSVEPRAVEAATATIANSTLSGNAAATSGGGVYSNGTMTLINATITGNTAGAKGGGIVTYGGALGLKRVLVAGNTAPTGREAHRQAGAVTAAGFNLFGFGGNAGLSGFSAGATDVVPGAAVTLAGIVGPLGNNGGPTLTHALAGGSPAIDRAPSADCLAEPVNGFDQRGNPRNANADGAPSANECDIGAFEIGFKVNVPVILR
jgi:hypothetical protein